MVLDTHYSQDRAEDGAGVKSQVSLMMKDSSLIEDGKLAMEVCDHDILLWTSRGQVIMMTIPGVPGDYQG